jgi:hypothetical protein
MLVQTKVALAGVCNGFILTDRSLRKENLEGVMMVSMKDYLRLSPESQQFDSEVVLSDLRDFFASKSWYTELLDLFGRMGYRAQPCDPAKDNSYLLEGDYWKEFATEAYNEWEAEKDGSTPEGHPQPVSPQETMV